MINKIYKRIHNQYSNIFKFLFYLRYVFSIFIVASVLFFLLPKLFNFEKKQEIVKDYLLSNYAIKIIDFKEINYNIFPQPNLQLNKVNIKLVHNNQVSKIENINIFLNIKNIYNLENFEAKKIFFKEMNMALDVKNLKFLISYIKELKKKLQVKDLNLIISHKENKPLIALKNINFTNYGLNKDRFVGEVFNNKFNLILKNNYKKIIFELLDTGIEANVDLIEIDNNNYINGSTRINLLNNFLKFDFKFDNKKETIEIFNSNFRNKNLLLSLDSLVNYRPFFYTKTDAYIKKIDNDIFNKIDLNKLFTKKKLIKKINSEINFNFENKNYFDSFVENFSGTLSVAFGRASFSKKIIIPGLEMNCLGDVNLIEEYPRLNFNCYLNLKDKKVLLKKFSIKRKVSFDNSKLKVLGSINLLNKKINFQDISSNNGYIANEEDKIFFKNKFENILYDTNFFNIFKKNKIKNFLLEII